MRCNRCTMFYSAISEIKAEHPLLHILYLERFRADPMSRRAFIVRSHKVPACTLRTWIKKKLHAMSSTRKSLNGKSINGKDGPSIHHNYTTADMNPVATFTQEHTHCHHLAIPRCLTCHLYVKWARHIYNLPPTHRTCGLVAFRTRAATTSTRQLTSDTVHGAKGSMSPLNTSGTGDTPRRIMLSSRGSGSIKDGREYRPKSIPSPSRLYNTEHDGADRCRWQGSGSWTLWSLKYISTLR